jgi:hypothetical protein
MSSALYFLGIVIPLAEVAPALYPLMVHQKLNRLPLISTFILFEALKDFSAGFRKNNIRNTSGL